MKIFLVNFSQIKQGLLSLFLACGLLSVNGQQLPINTLTPADNSEAVPVDQTLIMTFDREMYYKVIGTILTIWEGASPSDRVVFESFQNVSGDTRLTLSGNQLTINPTNEFKTNTIYHVQVLDGRLTDTPDGSTFVGFGFDDATVWNFTTVDLTAPTLQSTSPMDNGINIDISSTITLTFDDNIIATDLSAVQLIETGTGNVVPSVVNIAGKNVMIMPNADLKLGTNYHILISSSALKNSSDLFFGGIASASTFNFTTSSPPFLTATSPLDDAIGVATNSAIILSFDKDIQIISTVGMSVRRVSDDGEVGLNRSIINGNQLRLLPTSVLAQSTAYYVQLQTGTIADLQGNLFQGWALDNETAFNFTTSAPADVTAPTVVSRNPVSGSTGNSSGINPTITFSEDVRAVSGGLAFQLYQNTGAIFIESIPSSQWSISGSTITLNPSSPLVENVQYSIGMPANTVEDLSGNAAASVNRSQWIFTTGSDNTAPIEVSRSPVDNAIGVSLTPTITIAYNEDLFLNSGSFALTEYATDIELEYFFDGQSNTSVSGGTITLTPSTVLEAGTQYYISNKFAGFITDASGNAASSWSDKDFWNFTTDTGIQDQTITFEVITDKFFGESSFTLSASASSGLPVSYSVVSGPVMLSGNEVTITGAGMAEIAANQSGNASFNAAPEVVRTFIINKADQTITIEPINDQLITASPLNVVATTTSGLPLDFTVTGPATISGTTISLDGIVGTVTVTASQSGNDNYTAASDAESFEVTDVNQVLGLSEGMEVLIYPNPVQSLLNISTENLVEVQLFDLAGRLVLEEVSGKQLGLQHIDAGTYILVLTEGTRTTNYKLIKR